MKRQILVLLILGLSVLAYESNATTIQLELYNSYPLLASDALTPLAGSPSSGDLIQVILAGGNSAIDAPDSFGSASGDDTLLFTTHLGAGIPGPANGYVDAFPLNFDSSLINDYVYVRFWNGTTPGGSSYYGNSTLLQLPAGDAFNLASLDFVPLSSSPHVTDQPFGALVIPEPSNVFLYGMILLGVYLWLKRKQFA